MAILVSCIVPAISYSQCLYPAAIAHQLSLKWSDQRSRMSSPAPAITFSISSSIQSKAANEKQSDESTLSPVASASNQAVEREANEQQLDALVQSLQPPSDPKLENVASVTQRLGTSKDSSSNIFDAWEPLLETRDVFLTLGDEISSVGSSPIPDRPLLTSRSYTHISRLRGAS